VVAKQDHNGDGLERPALPAKGAQQWAIKRQDSNAGASLGFVGSGMGQGLLYLLHKL